MTGYGYQKRPDLAQSSQSLGPTPGSMVTMPSSQLPRAAATAVKDSIHLEPNRALYELELPPQLPSGIIEPITAWYSSGDEDEWPLEIDGFRFWNISYWAYDNLPQAGTEMGADDLAADSPTVVDRGLNGLRAVGLLSGNKHCGIQQPFVAAFTLPAFTVHTWKGMSMAFVCDLQDLSGTATLFDLINVRGDTGAVLARAIRFQFVPDGGASKLVVEIKRDPADSFLTLESPSDIVEGGHIVLLSWDLLTGDVVLRLDGAEIDSGSADSTGLWDTDLWGQNPAGNPAWQVHGYLGAQCGALNIGDPTFAKSNFLRGLVHEYGLYNGAWTEEEMENIEAVWSERFGV